MRRAQQGVVDMTIDPTVKVDDSEVESMKVIEARDAIAADRGALVVMLRINHPEHGMSQREVGQMIVEIGTRLEVIATVVVSYTAAVVVVAEVTMITTVNHASLVAAGIEMVDIVKGDLIALEMSLVVLFELTSHRLDVE